MEKSIELTSEEKKEVKKRGFLAKKNSSFITSINFISNLLLYILIMLIYITIIVIIPTIVTLILAIFISSDIIYIPLLLLIYMLLVSLIGLQIMDYIYSYFCS